METVLLINARIFDGQSPDCPEGQSVLVADGRVREIGGANLRAANAHVIDAGGRTLMPGLIDAHVHAYVSDINVQKGDAVGEAYRTAHAVRMLNHALDSGFTTVRDIGGGDYGLWRAIDDKLIRAPRFFYAGRILSMTGGHGDFRQMSETRHTYGYCSCGSYNSLCVVADGLAECVKAAREELRRGAHCIKIMGSGGVASPTDPIWMNQYREDEIRAIVNECAERHSYVAAHCHPASAIRRCVEFGVRCIEHGTQMDDVTARFVASKGAFVVPTLVTLRVLSEVGKELGLPPSSQEKVAVVNREAISGLESMRKAGVKVGFGTDLLGSTYSQQCREFTLRREVFPALEILRQATSVNAEILQQKDALGSVKVGAHADLLLVDGDPLQDIGLLAASGRHLCLIMRGGEIIKNGLA
jgi:imidazolonepropionase-like amidohydrolase